MIRLAVPVEKLPAYRALVLANDAASHEPSTATVDERLRGFASEDVFAQWLFDSGLHYRRFGGIDARPDVEVEGRSVSIRYCGARSPWTPSHSVYAWTRDLARGHEWFAFLGPVRPEKTDDVFLIGFASREQLETSGRFVAEGCELVAGFRAQYDLVALYVAELVDPTAWRGALR